MKDRSVRREEEEEVNKSIKEIDGEAEVRLGKLITTRQTKIYK